MAKKDCEVLETGIATCIQEPRGDNGLEGYNLGDFYKFERVLMDGKQHYRVWPPESESYETCGPNTFAKYFERK